MLQSVSSHLELHCQDINNFLLNIHFKAYVSNNIDPDQTAFIGSGFIVLTSMIKIVQVHCSRLKKQTTFSEQQYFEE